MCKNFNSYNKLHNLVSLAETSLLALSRNMGDVDGELSETKVLEELSSVLIDIQSTVGVGKVKSRDLRNVLITSLTLLLLELEGDTTDGTLLDTLHQVGGVTSNLFAKTLGGDVSILTGKTLVGLEVESELGVVTLDHLLSSTLDSLSSNATL